MSSEGEISAKSPWGAIGGCAAIITAATAIIGTLVAIGVINPNHGNTQSNPTPSNPAEQSSGAVVADFLLTHQKTWECSPTEYALTFRLDNTGDTAFAYIKTTIVDLHTNAVLYGTPEGKPYASTAFSDDPNGCFRVSVDSLPQVLPAGKVAYVSYWGVLDLIQRGHTARATVILCTQPPPDVGVCVDRRVDFDLYW